MEPNAEPTKCDAVTLELMDGALQTIVGEMETLLERTAMSPFIREKKDFAVALADANARIIAARGLNGNFMIPILERFPAEEMQPGDIYWYNDCYGSRGIVSHSPDQVFVAPVYHEGELIGFSHSWAHFNDIGGMHPGTLSPDATNIYQEGVIVPVVQLQKAGERNHDLQRMFEMNSRYPDMVRGDIRAMVAALALGERRLIELFERFGADVMRSGFDQTIERTATLVKAKFRELFAEGRYSFDEVVADDGRGNGPFNIRLELDVTADRVTLDTTKSDDQAPGAINYLLNTDSPAGFIGYYLLSLVPEAQPNQGLESLIDEVLVRPGSILQPHAPAALGQRGITLVRFMNALMGLVNKATNGKATASNSAYVIYSVRATRGKPFLMSDGVAIGYGARPFADGVDAVYVVGQKNYPAEFVETSYPIRMRAYGMLKDSAGPGRWRGGCAVFREIEVLAEEAQLSVRIDGVGNPPWGVAGGLSGRGGRAIINPGRPDEREIPALSDGTILKRGDVFRIETVGGGGWGDPLDREPERVQEDVLAGLVSERSALEDYGVVLSDAGRSIDQDATQARRLEMASAVKEAAE